MKVSLTALLGAAGALAACTDYPPPAPMAAAAPGAGAPAADVAPARTPTGSGCFRSHDISGHRIADERTVYVRVLHRDVFRLQSSNSCFAGSMPDDPLLIREPPGVSVVCRAIDIDLSVLHDVGGTPGMRTPCLVQSMTQLTPAEIAALPPKLRP
jgi:hypothetical protein